MNNTDCNYRSSWTDSGDRGADMDHHTRTHHPDHAHWFVTTPYTFEPVSVKRCFVCKIAKVDDKTGQCK